MMFKMEEIEIPLMFKLKGTVILTIWWQILLILLYTAGLVYVHNYVDGINIQFPQTLIPVLGVVTGLLLVFRTNTAYDRYWEGRKLWSQMTFSIRTLTRTIWVMVKGKTSEEVLEKISAINLLVAFAYATKNYLREKYSYDKEDIRELTNHLPKFYTPSSNAPLDAQDDNVSMKSKRSGFGSKGNVNYRIRLNSTSSRTSISKKKQVKTSNHRAYEEAVPTNIPIELSYYIASYINHIIENKLVDGSMIPVLNNALNTLVECLGGFERILRTPIPLAYSVHLHHATWIYLLALPYQLIGVLNWYTIPAVGLASFALLGILGIGWEIENPFGYDANDLPLGDFCKVIRKEILNIVANPMPDVKDWMLSPQNHPLDPVSQKTASELKELDLDVLRSLIAKGNTVRFSKNSLDEPDVNGGWFC